MTSLYREPLGPASAVLEPFHRPGFKRHCCSAPRGLFASSGTRDRPVPEGEIAKPAASAAEEGSSSSFPDLSTAPLIGTPSNLSSDSSAEEMLLETDPGCSRPASSAAQEEQSDWEVISPSPKSSEDDDEFVVIS